MSKIASHILPPPSAELKQDLAMVLPTLRVAESAEIKAFWFGEPIAVDQAMSQATSLLRESKAPAIIGLSGLTIEAMRETIALAESMRAMLLPWPFLPWPCGDVAAARQSIVQTATLGHAASADLRVAFRDDPTRQDSPIDQWITQRVPNTLFVDGADLEALLRLRAKVREQGAAVFTSMTALPVKSIVVTLPAGVDCRIESQWHALAADAQQKIRISVMTLPDLRAAGNQRGAMEVMTWQTGLSGAAGGITFADGAPRPCPGASELLELGAIDTALDTGLTPLPPVLTQRLRHRIRISAALDKSADLCFITPGLSPGLRAQVMRFDGTILWLCDDPSPKSDAMDDPAIALISQLKQRVS